MTAIPSSWRGSRRQSPNVIRVQFRRVPVRYQRSRAWFVREAIRLAVLGAFVGAAIILWRTT